MTGTTINIGPDFDSQILDPNAPFPLTQAAGGKEKKKRKRIKTKKKRSKKKRTRKKRRTNRLKKVRYSQNRKKLSIFRRSLENRLRNS